MGWKPNHILSALSTGKTKLIGLWQLTLGQSYHAWVMQTVEQLLREDGYAMLSSPARKKNSPEDFELDLFNRWSVDGLIALDGSHYLHHFLKNHPHWDLPVVNMGWFPLKDHPLVDSVYVDVLSPAREALEQWVDEGRTRIAMLSGQYPGLGKMDEREKMYREFIRRRGLNEELIGFPADTQRIGAEKTLCEHISRYGCPDAIFCRKDEVLMGAYRALRKLGYSIPSDTVLLGIDGIQDTQYLDQPISTVVQPVEIMCQTAWDMLKSRIAFPRSTARHTTLRASLDWRGGEKLC